MLIFFAKYLYIFFNEAIELPKFPSSFKLANITPVLKKVCRNQKENYRPVSSLPIMSKIFQNILTKQLAGSVVYIVYWLYCHFNKIIKRPGASFQFPTLSQKHIRNVFNTVHWYLTVFHFNST